MTLPATGDTRLITFDCYGTLIDWDTALISYVGSILDSKGADLPVTSFYETWYHQHALPALGGPFMRYRELLQTTLHSALADAGLPVEPGDGADFGDAMAEAKPFPEVPAVLARLKERFRLATISNSQHDILKHSVKHLGDPFDFAFTAEDTGTYKPHAALFELVLSRAGVTAGQAVHVAQSQYVDLPRSVPMGLPTVWVNRKHQQRRPEVPAPHAIIHDLESLPALLGC